MKSKLVYSAMVMGMTMLAPAAKADCSAMGPRMIAWAALPQGLEAPAPMAVPAVEPRGKGSATIDGLWKTTFSSGGQVVDQAFEVFHSDGTEVMVDTAPPSSGNVCVGVWVRTNGLTFQLNHPSWTFDEKGNLTGTATIKMSITLAANSNKFTGTFTVDIATLAGVVVQHLSGTVAGERIQVE
jgi:hypothetical protein